MPVNSNRFNRFLLILLSQCTVTGAALAQLPRLSDSDLQTLGQRIYANECNQRYECLTSWNNGEEFPSLGIGHFIWYRQGQQAPFEETFPALLDYLKQHDVNLPPWLDAGNAADAPWQNREEFLEQVDSEKMGQLRRLLLDTRALQSAFIAERLHQTLPQLLAAVPASRRGHIEQRFLTLANSAAPYGIYALIDYVHFKGTGLSSNERYQGQGWGLLQVLETMQGQTTLTSFVAAAEQVLNRRVANAPPARREQRWLAGWHARLATYLPESASLATP